MKRLDTTYIALNLATALCQQKLIISMQFQRQLLGGEMLALHWVALFVPGLWHFSMCGSEQHTSPHACVCVWGWGVH